MVIAAPSQAFFHLNLSKQENYYRLSFSVKDETNIRYYLIEGSQDMISFDRLTRIYAKGNSHLPRTYNATIYNTGYRYYRIRQVDNAYAAGFSSTIISSKYEPISAEEAIVSGMSADIEFSAELVSVCIQ
jgi:hypothetical protein